MSPVLSPPLQSSVARLAAALAALVVLVLLPAPASAHASLVSSTPRQGEQLPALPSEVRFEFSEEMSAPAYVIVTAPDGSSVTSGDPVVDGSVVSQAVTDGPEGSYTMAYRAVSEDGHPVTGQIEFTVGDDPATATEPTGDESRSSAPAAEAEAAAPAETESWWSRHFTTVLVGGGLFAGALVLALLARRSAP